MLSVCVFLSQCALLNEKLDSLVKALSEEAEAQVTTSVVSVNEDLDLETRAGTDL